MATIRLVISDIDGSLVTREKKLTPAAVAAVHDLHRSGVQFTAVSSRPPFGMRMLIEPLKITLPLGAFNGSTVFNPDMTLAEHRPIPRDAVSDALDFLRSRKIDAWLFTTERWLVQHADGPYLAREKMTIDAEPELLGDPSPLLDQICKIVGVSEDFDRLAACEPDLKAALGKAAHVARSQNYYLDVTPPGYDKGTFVETTANRLDIPLANVAVIGDMTNDLPMFLRAGVSFAMGNASDAVKKKASHTTASNQDDGFAKAVAQILAI